jgi:nitrate reductase assembly molybdenum cofactor insertion protein NarJ
MDAKEMTPAVRELLTAAVEWRLLGMLFERPLGDWAVQLAEVAKETASVELQNAVNSALKDACEAQYHATFGPCGPLSVREATYRKTMNLGQYLSQLSSLYDGFAYKPALDEAPDHIAVELGFVAYLHLKKAYALSQNDAEQAAIAGDVLERFLQEHVSTLAAPVALALRDSSISYYDWTAKAIQQRIEKYVRQPVVLPEAAEDDRETFNCASGPGCAAAESAPELLF